MSQGEFCGAINCRNSRKKTPELSFFRFPKAPDRCKQWIQNSKRGDLIGKAPERLHKSLVLCSKHFEENQFMNAASRNRLVWNAVPTIFEVLNPAQKRTPKRRPPASKSKPAISSKKIKIEPSEVKDCDAGCSTTSQDDEKSPCYPRSSPSVASQLLIPRKRRRLQTYIAKIHRLQKMDQTPEQEVPVTEKREVDKLIEEISHVLSGPALDFVSCQLRLSKVKSEGQGWTPHDEASALSLLHSSPRTYWLLQKIFQLPSVETLSRSMQNVDVHPGFNVKVLEVLKQKVTSMSAHSRLCAVVIDKISIKESVTYNVEEDEIEGFENFGSLGKTKFVANHATVFMVRGLTSKWKQPLGYFLSSGPMDGSTIKVLLLQCIEKLTASGIQVKVIIGDHGASTRNLFETELGVSAEKPYFMLSEMKVYVLYDPRILVKKIRNDFKKHGLTVNGEPVLWDYVRQFYEADSKLPIRMAPNLTAKHVDLPQFAPLRVKLATQVLSHSVAAGISAMCSLGALPTDAQHTAAFIEKMDRLFNCFSSSTLQSNAKMRHAISERSGHKSFLLECLEWLPTVESRGKRKLPCLFGWKMAITCLLQLWDDLHQAAGVMLLLTNRLNKDCTENLFSVIRGKGGHRDNLDALQFRTAFNKAVVDAIMMPIKDANCPEDVDAFLLSLKSIGSPAGNVSTAFSVTLETEDLPESVRSLLSVCSVPVPFTQFPSDGKCSSSVCIAGYLCQKICSKVCEKCKNTLQISLDPQNPAHIFLYQQNYGDTVGGGMVVPSPSLCDFVQVLEEEYRQVVDSIMHMDRVRSRLVALLDKSTGISVSCCQCQCKSLLLNLYVTVRLHHSLKDSSLEISSWKGRRSRKVVKFSLPCIRSGDVDG